MARTLPRRVKLMDDYGRTKRLLGGLAFLLWSVLVVFICRAAWRCTLEEDRTEQDQGGASKSSATLIPTPSAEPLASPPFQLEASARIADDAAARHQQADEAPPPSTPEVPASPDYSWMADLDEGFQPTAQGLYALTAEQWGQDAMRELTGAEAKELISAYLNATLVPLWGTEPSAVAAIGLPTMADCELGAADTTAIRLLGEAQVQAATIARLQLLSTPTLRRKGTLIQQANSLRIVIEASLMRRLEEVTGYKHWSLMHDLFEALVNGEPK